MPHAGSRREFLTLAAALFAGAKPARLTIDTHLKSGLLIRIFRKVDLMRIMTVLMCFACATGAFAAGRQRIMPAGAKVAGPYSPGILTGDFLYVAGQGAEDAQGRLAADQEGQIRQCLNNIKAVVDAAGLSMEHVVYVQAYLMDYSDEGPLNRVWKEFFPAAPPARSTIGVAKLVGTTVEMSAVAVRDLSMKKCILPPNTSSAVPISPGRPRWRSGISFRVHRP